MYDCHAHVIGPAPHDTDWPHATPPASLDDYIAALDANGVAKGVLVQPRAHGLDNDLVLAAIARYPERLRGVAVVPADADTASLRRLHEAGIRGVRLGGQVPVETISVLAPRLAEAGLHVQLLMREADLLRWRDVIAACPVPVVIDHLAHPDPLAGTEGAHVRALDELLGLGHVHAKLSAVYRWASGPDWADGQAIVRYLVDGHAGKLVWGSDWPFLNQDPPGPSYAGLISYLHRLVDGQDRATILEHVPKTLYGF